MSLRLSCRISIYRDRGSGFCAGCFAHCLHVAALSKARHVTYCNKCRGVRKEMVLLLRFADAAGSRVSNVSDDPLRTLRPCASALKSRHSRAIPI